MIKQTKAGVYANNQSDGCFFMSDLSISEDLTGGEELTVAEVNRCWDYAIPRYMKDGGHIAKDRAFILNHEEIIRIGLYVMGRRYSEIRYLVRRDGDRFLFGDAPMLWECNFFIKEVNRIDGHGTHFLRCDLFGRTLYNPGISDGPPISLRGFRVR